MHCMLWGLLTSLCCVFTGGLVLAVPGSAVACYACGYRSALRTKYNLPVCTLNLCRLLYCHLLPFIFPGYGRVEVYIFIRGNFFFKILQLLTATVMWLLWCMHCSIFIVSSSVSPEAHYILGVHISFLCLFLSFLCF